MRNSCDRCWAVAWTAVAFVVLVASTTIVVGAAGQVYGGFATVEVLDHPFTLANSNPPLNGAMFGAALDVHQGRLVVTTLIGYASVCVVSTCCWDTTVLPPRKGGFV